VVRMRREHRAPDPRARLYTIESAVAAKRELAAELQLIAVAAIGTVNDQVERRTIARARRDHLGEVVDGNARLRDKFGIRAVLRRGLNDLLERSLSRHVRDRNQSIRGTEQAGDVPRESLVNAKRARDFLGLLRVGTDAVVKLNESSF